MQRRKRPQKYETWAKDEDTRNIVHTELRWVLSTSGIYRYSSPATRQGGDWGERRYSCYSSLTSALDGSEWSASRPSRALPPGKGSPVPTVKETKWAPEPVWTQMLEKKNPLPLSEIEPQIFRHYTDRVFILYGDKLISSEYEPVAALKCWEGSDEATHLTLTVRQACSRNTRLLQSAFLLLQTVNTTHCSLACKLVKNKNKQAWGHCVGMHRATWLSFHIWGPSIESLVNAIEVLFVKPLKGSGEISKWIKNDFTITLLIRMSLVGVQQTIPPTCWWHIVQD
jgi:hypothetical protein